jgi:hypothetical protein
MTPNPESRTHTLGFKVTAERDAELRALAKFLGWSMTELLNRMIDEVLPEMKRRNGAG